MKLIPPLLAPRALLKVILGSVLFTQVDSFAQQASTSLKWPRGAGVHASLVSLMPYAQVGWYPDGESGVFATLGVVSLGGVVGLPPEELFVSPAIGFELRFPPWSLRGQVGGVLPIVRNEDAPLLGAMLMVSLGS